MLHDGSMSSVDFKRSFLAEFAGPEQLDLKFRDAYEQVQMTWSGRFGWPLHLRPEDADPHSLSTARIPVTDSQSEFDAHALVFTKFLIDSLNDSELVREVGRGKLFLLGV